MKTLDAIKTAAAVLLLAAPARAIELSLEENRAERGSVGFVDMQRLFSTSPDAQRAKEGFEDLIRQAEERVNQRKAELIKLRQDLDATRAERDALAVSTETAAAPAPSPVPAAPSATAVAASTAIAATPAAPTVAGSTAAPRALALPGMAPVATAPTAPPPAAEAPKALATPAPVAASSAPAAAAPAAAASSAPRPTGPTLAQRLLELDGKIISLQAAIAAKEREVASEREDADKGLLDVEGRKTDQVLARLYRAISAVARQEGVSVIVDRSTILYGHPAMDLTDKVLQSLRGHEQP